ncbi:mite allergen Der p 3-like [Drosophila kikkawai]|uniref:Mite allergen Der p 3-like n=1 Tax=Drosophila kikkawai TaxID=30033 RepID=A0A6P4IFF9_DROKI|nr:mite allergen Der p 3-like [Drosophila kikkawai]
MNLRLLPTVSAIAIFAYLWSLVADAEPQGSAWNGHYLDNGTHYLLYEAPKIRRQDYLALANISSNPAINALESLDYLPTRIVNGKRIRCTRARYQCALHYQGSFICGCVILSHRWILTAHHCIIGSPEDYSVRAGSVQQRRGGQLRRVQKIVAHGGYNDFTMNNDIAMMKLKKPLKFNRCCRRVRLPRRRRRRRLPRCCLASGWGLASENAQNVQRYLRGVIVCKVRRRRCVRSYRKAGIKITKHMICYARKNRDTCSGDSGGPLVHKNILIGITSFGIGCARKRYSGVYTDAGDYVKWIKMVMRKH